jgi:polyhydroxybutyrate depolymerase
MKIKRKTIIVGVLGTVIGVPVIFVAVLLAWCSLADKTNGTIVSSGVTRRYLLYLPKTYDHSKPTPLIISIHPAATWPALERNLSGWNDVAEQYGFIVVYPAGSGVLFGGFGPGPQVWPGEPQDVKLIADLIDKLEAEYNIDPKRIYANGMSNGGGMAVLSSCKLHDRIAAVGVVAGALPQSEDYCSDSKPMPTVVFHGTADKFAPYDGGASPIAPRQFANIPDWTAGVAKRNHCTGESRDTRISPSVRRRSYTNCSGEADVILYTVEGGGHTWPGGKHLAEWIAGRTTDEISASRVMWEFFWQHPLQEEER